MGVYNQSAIKSLFNGKSKTTDAEKEDLMTLLESLPLSQRKELYRFVKKNDSMFTKDEVEIYKAGSTIRGIENLRILIKKKNSRSSRKERLKKVTKSGNASKTEHKLFKRGLKKLEQLRKRRQARLARERVRKALKRQHDTYLIEK